MKKITIFLLIIIGIIILLGAGFLGYKYFSDLNNKEVKQYSQNDIFRNLVVQFVRKTADNYFKGRETKYPEELKTERDWQVKVSLYLEGEIKGEGRSDEKILALGLKKATEIAINDKRIKKLNEEDVKSGRFLVSLFSNSDKPFSFIEYDNEGIEIVDDLAIIRSLDKNLIYQKIKEGKEFLLSMENKDYHGFYKKYDVPADYLTDRLHAVYSASIIYTFLYLNDFEKDEKISENFSQWADFLLSMQSKEEGKRYGAFHYSYYFKIGEKEKRFPVGTSALSIFTLLRLYDLTNESRYLESAKLAGDWLTTMQMPNGVVKPYTRYSDEGWVYGTKESLLYNGQVLSSLSKLYKATSDEKYYKSAEKIANHFAEKYEAVRDYVEGEYRSKNPISNAWIVMSLMDFYKINPDSRYKDIIFGLSAKILENQKKDKNNVWSYGQWEGAYSTSGIGWLCEVMAETYHFCQEERGDNCEKYKEAIIRGMKWVIQRTYSQENSFLLINPEKAIGGVFWSKKEKYVRTDSNCHALNGYVLIFNDLEEGLLVSLPEESLDFLEK